MKQFVMQKIEKYSPVASFEEDERTKEGLLYEGHGGGSSRSASLSEEASLEELSGEAAVECEVLVARINDRIGDIKKLRAENDLLSAELRRVMSGRKAA